VTDVLQRLRERKLVQWALAYAAVAFALLQGVDIVAQRFGWPESIERGLIVAFAVGFLVTLVLAWYHGERGAQRISRGELALLALLVALGGGAMWMVARAPDGAPSGRGDAVTGAAPAHDDESIAVLPLANDSGDQDQQYFSDGLSEDLITALSQFPGLKVIGRNSSFQFRDSKDDSRAIGAKLGVAHLLEGSVRRAGDVVRINAQLIRAADGSTLWSQRYDRPYQDLFALQDEITHAVSVALKARLLPGDKSGMHSDRPPSGRLDAYDAYLQASFYYARRTEADVRKGLELFEEAARLDPDYAQSWATASRAWISLRSSFLQGDAAQVAAAKARAAADAALRLDPGLPAAHIARGYVLQTVDLDWRGMEAEYRKAAELAPDDSITKFVMGILYATLGQPERALAQVDRALEGDPLHVSWQVWRGSILCALGRLDEAESSLRKAIELQPAAAIYHEQLALVAIVRGDTDAALAAAQEEPPGKWRDIALALARQIGPDRAAADKALALLIERHAGDSAYQVAKAHVLRQDPDHAFEWLDRAFNQRDPDIFGLLCDPLILRLRSDPRYAAFLGKVGLKAPDAA
jgi:TolB-like protein/Tfp pilus assembly protein PilF